MRKIKHKFCCGSWRKFSWIDAYILYNVFPVFNNFVPILKNKQNSYSKPLSAVLYYYKDKGVSNSGQVWTQTARKCSKLIEPSDKLQQSDCSSYIWMRMSVSAKQQNKKSVCVSKCICDISRDTHHSSVRAPAVS